jgi:hypothetical protein
VAFFFYCAKKFKSSRADCSADTPSHHTRDSAANRPDKSDAPEEEEEEEEGEEKKKKKAYGSEGTAGVIAVPVDKAETARTVNAVVQTPAAVATFILTSTHRTRTLQKKKKKKQKKKETYLLALLCLPECDRHRVRSDICDKLPGAADSGDRDETVHWWRAHH